MNRGRRRTIRDGVIALAVFPLAIGVSGVNNLHSLVFGMCVGWIAVYYVAAAIFEVIAWQDERRMAREYMTTGPGRPMSAQARADVEEWLRRNDGRPL